MNDLKLLALRAWSESSNEGLLVIDSGGLVCLVNSRLRELFNLHTVPQSVDALLRQADYVAPDLRALLSVSKRPDHTQWGNLHVLGNPPQRLIWQQIPLFEGSDVAGSLVIFRDATTQGQLELAKQSFLSMISHDLRTPLSTILGFAELLYNNRGTLSDEEQTEFLEHIIKNANQLSRYAQIALDIMYLEANRQQFDTESVFLDRFVKHWLKDALHRFPAEQIVYHNGAAAPEPMSQIAPSALHRILYILVEFALAESPLDEFIDIRLDYDAELAHVMVQHHAPDLSGDDATALFRLMHPRDLSESGRPKLHRMQLYVASLLAERQQGHLTLRGEDDRRYQFDLTMPLALSPAN